VAPPSALEASARPGTWDVGAVLRKRRIPAMKNSRVHRWTRGVGGGGSLVAWGWSTVWEPLEVAISQSELVVSSMDPRFQVVDKG
jgi:hypothetical protein